MDIHVYEAGIPGIAALAGLPRWMHRVLPSVHKAVDSLRGFTENSPRRVGNFNLNLLIAAPDRIPDRFRGASTPSRPDM